MTLPMLSIGAKGVISVAGNLVPERMLALLAAFRSGDLSAAQREHLALFPLMQTLFIETNPIPVKAAAELLGLVGPDLRLPLVAASDETRDALRGVLSAFRKPDPRDPHIRARAVDGAPRGPRPGGHGGRRPPMRAR